MKSKQLSTGDLCELSSIPMNTLDRWARQGIIKPIEGGSGQGSHRRFSISQAVALVFAAEWRRWGAGKPLIEPMIPHIAKMTHDEMFKAFAEGRTHLLELPCGPLSKPLFKWSRKHSGEPFDRFDLRRVYLDVMKRILEIERREKKAVGRSRGLASKST